MQKEAAITAGLLALALLLMLAARSLYPEIPQVESGIRVETPLNATRTQPVEGTGTTTTPQNETPATMGPEQTETPENVNTTQTPTPIGGETETKPRAGYNETKPQKPVESPAIGVAFYNSILAVLSLEENERTLKGIVKNAYIASVEGVCDNCVAVLILESRGKEVAVVLVNEWKVENGGEVRESSIELAKKLLGEQVTLRGVKLPREINGLEAYSALEIEWDGYEAELLKGEYEPEEVD